MNWFKKLFGGNPADGPAASAKSLEYKGFIIEAQPYKDGGQFQLAGMISKDGRQYRFVRADKFTDKGEAADIALNKGKLIIDQMGEGLFNT